MLLLYIASYTCVVPQSCLHASFLSQWYTKVVGFLLCLVRIIKINVYLLYMNNYTDIITGTVVVLLHLLTIGTPNL